MSATESMTPRTTSGTTPSIVEPNGAALAAFLAAGIGAFAMGLFVLLSEAGIFTAPSLYGPAGGVSGRTTFAVVTWLIAWALVHRRWKGRHVEPASVWAVTLALFAFALLATFPPVWAIFG
jgi:hypothetical protein